MQTIREFEQPEDKQSLPEAYGGGRFPYMNDEEIQRGEEELEIMMSRAVSGRRYEVSLGFYSPGKGYDRNVMGSFDDLDEAIRLALQIYEIGAVQRYIKAGSNIVQVSLLVTDTTEPKSHVFPYWLVKKDVTGSKLKKVAGGYRILPDGTYKKI